MSSMSSHISSYRNLRKYILSSRATSILVMTWIKGASTGILVLNRRRMLLMVFRPVTGEILMKFAMCIRVFVLNMRNLP